MACAEQLLAALWTEWTEHRAKGSGRTGGGWGLLPEVAPRHPSLHTQRPRYLLAVSVHLCFRSAPRDSCSARTWLLRRARPRLPSSWAIRSVLSPLHGCRAVLWLTLPADRHCRTWMPASARIQSGTMRAPGSTPVPVPPPSGESEGWACPGLPCSGPDPVVLGPHVLLLLGLPPGLWPLLVLLASEGGRSAPLHANHHLCHLGSS